MILNPDTVLKSDTLEKIFDISKNLEFGILSPLSDNKEYPNYKITTKIKNLDNNLIEVDQVDGYAMILDTYQFNGKFFDEKIFMYLENDDLCLRIKNESKKVYVYKDSKISHLGAKAVDEKYYKELELSRNWHWNWSIFYYQKKHFGFFKAFNSGLTKFVRSIFKSVYYFITNDKFKSKLYFCRASGFLNALFNKRSWYRPRLD